VRADDFELRARCGCSAPWAEGRQALTQVAQAPRPARGRDPQEGRRGRDHRVREVLGRQARRRTGRNPQTGATIKVEASKSPKFTAGATLKTIVANKRK
jgi:hypothetical protein